MKMIRETIENFYQQKVKKESQICSRSF